MPDPARLGGRIGPRLAGLFSDAAADHLHKSAATRARIHAEGLNRFTDLIGEEARPHLGPVWQQLAAAPDLPDHFKKMFTFAATGRGEWSTALNLIGANAAASAGIGTVLSNMLAPFTQHLLALSPALLLPYGQYAQLAAQRVISPAELDSRGARQGMMTGDMQALLEGSWNRPDLAVLLELLRRGQMDLPQAIHALRRQGYAEEYISVLLNLRRVPLAPADAALMVLRGIIDEGAGRQIGAEAGYAAADFDRLVLATGEPPGPQSLMEALRRGFIDNSRFAHGIRQSRIRNEWIGLMEQLRFSPASTADAINATIRGYIPESESRRIAEQNGLEPGHFDFLLKGAGRPPGHGEMIQLQRRGLVSQAAVDQAVRESDIKDKYVGTLRGLYHHLPPERTVISMVSHGALSTSRGLHLLEELGFAPDIAAALVKTGAVQRTAGHKHLAVGTVTELYEDHAIDKARATKLIEGLGYPAEDVPLVLSLAELRRHRKWRDQAIGAIRSGFLKRHIDQAEAQAELAAAGVEQPEVQWLMRLWALELRTTRRSLTEAQIMHGYRRGQIDAAEAGGRLERLGYSAADATFLMQTSGPIPKGA